MDALKTQIFTLNQKVDRLYELVDRLSEKISVALSDYPVRSESSQTSIPQGVALRENYLLPGETEELHLLMDHKDVLGDETHIEIGGSNTENPLTPEIQIQRLTAQLTAAYNRIAALEEQLLSRTDASSLSTQRERLRIASQHDTNEP
ncbi:MAG: hypothetical protein J7641_15240 [Cyanobacteria bacterium SID2]|nr:hypothetical protein [Cyanobacteria bacterium SID2]